MTRADNRAAFPGIADIIDQVRVHFPNAKLLHGEEGGREIGNPVRVPAGCCEIDWMQAALIEADFGRCVQGKRK